MELRSITPRRALVLVVPMATRRAVMVQFAEAVTGIYTKRQLSVVALVLMPLPGVLKA